MTMICHNLSPKIPTDVAFAESRIRPETIAAENVLHDMGAISVLSSDSQAMGRIGETWLRVIQAADAMKNMRGKLPEDTDDNDNNRILRYVSKVTINPAIVQGISHVAGSIEVGKLADIVLWDPAFFGANQKMIIKGGMINWALMGDPNASLMTPQPACYRPMFSAKGRAKYKTRVTFTSNLALENNIVEKYELKSKVEAVCNTRTISKADMVRNDRLPDIEVNPETFAIKVDGEHATVEPMKDISLNQMYFFS